MVDDRIAIVALRYLEPYYTETERCLQECRRASDQVTIFWTHRDGIGNMPRAFNDGLRRVFKEVRGKSRFRKIWFTTDITFDPDTPLRLARAMDEHNLVAIQPAYPSDHHFLRCDGSGEVKEVPYIEWTAPMVDAQAMGDIGGLEENHWFWYYDLLASRELRIDGGQLGVHHGVQIDHCYRGRAGDPLHPLTAIRYQLRDFRDPIEKKLLHDRFGPDWVNILWCKGEKV